jgi:hypothetical protein
VPTGIQRFLFVFHIIHGEEGHPENRKRKIKEHKECPDCELGPNTPRITVSSSSISTKAR